MATATMDLFAGMAARDEGIAQAAESRNQLVNKVREHLRLIAISRGNRCVTADDYEGFLTTIGESNRALGNAAGAIFKHPDWEFTGVWTPSRRKTNNARHIRVWRLK
jgi:hypothetical protein